MDKKVWWNRAESIPVKDSNFQKILNFYLFNCPVVYTQKRNKKVIKKAVSERAKTFIDQGWEGYAIPTLLSEMKNCAYNLNYKPLKKNVLIDNSFLQKEEIQAGEMIFFLEREDMGDMYAIYYGIRNAFAHGSFSVVKQQSEMVYYLQSAKEGVTKSAMRLRERTLLKWIELFYSTTDDLAKIKKERKNANNRARKKRERMSGAA